MYPGKDNMYLNYVTFKFNKNIYYAKVNKLIKIHRTKYDQLSFPVSPILCISIDIIFCVCVCVCVCKYKTYRI